MPHSHADAVIANDRVGPQKLLDRLNAARAAESAAEAGPRLLVENQYVSPVGAKIRAKPLQQLKSHRRDRTSFGPLPRVCANNWTVNVVRRRYDTRNRDAHHRTPQAGGIAGLQGQ